MKQDRWWQEVEEIIQKNSLLKHPFYQAWQGGRLSLDDLRYYAKQYYSQVARFPRYVSAVHSNVEDIGARQMLLANLLEEEQGEENHPELWLRFAEGLGLDRQEVIESLPQRETLECVRTFSHLTKNENPVVGLAALYAYESQIPEVSATKREGLKNFYGITDDRSHEFFRVHQQADVWHSQVERETLRGIATSEEDREAVKRSVEAACRAVWNLLDGVVEARQICASC